MAFTPTTWIDGTTAITATELNRIEAGIEDAHAGDIDKPLYAGFVSSTAAANVLPSGWSAAQIGTGWYRVTHGLNTSSYALVPVVSHNASTGASAAYVVDTADTVDVRVYVESGGTLTLTNKAFSFILMKYA